MEYLFLVLMAVICFGGLLFSYRFWGLSAVYCFAIGGAVNSNIFHIGSYAITIGNFVFGLDSVIYSLFIFSVLLTLIEYDKKSAMVLTHSSMGAIAFAAIVQFVADWATIGVGNTSVTWSLISFGTSIIATYIAIIAMVYLFNWLKVKNINTYLNITIVMVVASIINSAIYFGVVAIFNGGFESNFGYVLASSYIGKAMSIVFALLCYFLIIFQRKKKVKMDNKKITE